VGDRLAADLYQRADYGHSGSLAARIEAALLDSRYCDTPPTARL
jgi:hypothetical protein